MDKRSEHSNRYTTRVKDRLVIFKRLGPAKQPAFKDVTSVSAVAFTNDGQLVVVNLRRRGLDLPGGHVEPGEMTPAETINREVMEEACMTIRDPVLVEVVESNYFEDRPTYLLVYGAYVDQLMEFRPNGESIARVIISPDDFIEQYTAGDKSLMKLTIDSAKKQLL